MDASAYKQVVLRKGASVRLRPIRSDDAPRLITLCHRLSLRTVYQRFFSPRRLRPEEADTFADGDYRERMAVFFRSIVPSPRPCHPPSTNVGRGRFLGRPVARHADQAELLPRIDLRNAGARHDIGHFRADVLTENRRALRLLARYTDMAQSMTSDRVTSVTFRRHENSAGSAVEPSQEVIPNVEALAQYSGRKKGGHGLASTTTEHSQGATGRVSDDARPH